MNTKNKIQKITIILAIVLMLFNFMRSNVAMGYGAVEDDPGKDNSMQTSGDSKGSIASATTGTGISEADIIAKIKEKANVDDEMAKKIYKAATEDTTKIKVTWSTKGYANNGIKTLKRIRTNKKWNIST